MSNTPDQLQNSFLFYSTRNLENVTRLFLWTAQSFYVVLFLLTTLRALFNRDYGYQLKF